jgi:RNA polymerase sigma factor (sigma-70 family)
VSTDLITRAQAGDEEAFRELIGPYRSELQVHCYRILGSVQDAEDALQEALLSAWQGLGGFEGRASVRSWLYRVTTSRCLNALRSGRRRPRTSRPPGGEPPEPTRLREPVWLEPYPDLLLEGLPDDAPGPEAAYETGAVADVVALLTDDVLLAMPPLPLEYQGRDLAARFLATVAFRDGRRYRMVATRANGQPAFAVYLRDPQTGVAHANGLLVFTLAGRRVSAITRFDNSALPSFGMPRVLPD